MLFFASYTFMINYLVSISNPHHHFFLSKGLIAAVLGSQDRIPASLVETPCQKHLLPLLPPANYVYPSVLLVRSLLLLVLLVATWRAVKNAEEALLTHAPPPAGSSPLDAYLADGTASPQDDSGNAPPELPHRMVRASRALLPVFAMEFILGTLQALLQLPAAVDWDLGAGSVDGLLFSVRVTLITLGMLCGNPNLWRYILRWRVRVVCGTPAPSSPTVDPRFRSTAGAGGSSRAAAVPASSAGRVYFKRHRGKKKTRAASNLSVVVDQGSKDSIRRHYKNSPSHVSTATHIELSVSSRNPSPVGGAPDGEHAHDALGGGGGGDYVRRYSNSSSISIAVSSRGASGQEDDFQMFINYPVYGGGESCSFPNGGRLMSNTSSGKGSLTSVYSINLQNWDEPVNATISKKGSNKLSLCSVNSVDEHGFLTPAPVRHSYHFARDALPSSKSCSKCQRRSSSSFHGGARKSSISHTARPQKPRPPHSTICVKPQPQELNSADIIPSQEGASKGKITQSRDSQKDVFHTNASQKISECSITQSPVSKTFSPQNELTQPVFSQPGQILSPVPSPTSPPKTPTISPNSLDQASIECSEANSTQTWASKAIHKKRRLPHIQPATCTSNFDTNSNPSASPGLLIPALPRRGRSVPNNPFPSKPESREGFLEGVDDARLQRQTLPKMQCENHKKDLTPVA